MTHRERFLAVLDRKEPDRMPFVPRLEVWYGRHSTMGTLPPRYAGKSAKEIYQMMDCGMPGREAIIYEQDWDLEVVIDEQERTMKRTYVTPYGDVSELFRIDRDAIKKGGFKAKTAGKAEYMVKGPDDFKKVEYVINSMRFNPCYDKYVAYQEEMGDAGEATTRSEYCAFYYMMEKLIGLSNFWFMYYDYTKEVESLYNVICEKHKNDMTPVVKGCPARHVAYGRHHDTMMTPTPIFEKYMKPIMRIIGDEFRSAGILHCIHADADSKSLLELYMESGVDLMECYCTYPMVSVTMEETLQRVGDKMLVWGGIPSTLLVPLSYDQKYFLDYIDDLFKVLERYKGKSRVVLGIADNVLPEADIERVEIISERCANFKF